MIASEASERVSKSPKKPKVNVRLQNDKSESEDTDVDSGRGVESDVESADEGDLEAESEGEDEGSSSIGGEDEEEVGEAEAGGSGSDTFEANPGWADAIRKILGTKKPKRKKTIVLSKAKRLCDVKPKEQVESSSFQVEGKAVGVVKDEWDVSKGSQVKEDKEAEHGRRKRRETDLGIRVKPLPLDRERERMLQKIATKGVVQLFNAVRQQQKDIKERLEEAGPLERKRDKVLKNIDKRAFLDVLMGGTKSVPVDGPVKVEKREKNTREEKEGNQDAWNVLRDDFMMGAKLKDWDKTAEEGEADSSAPEDMDSDD